MKKKRETVERESYQEKDILKIDEIPVCFGRLYRVTD